jgi:hypothetical protein
MGASFRLPPDGRIYADRIFARCRDLVGYQVWSGIQRPRLDAWIANFRTAEERYFAASVLDALIYRSDDQTIALLRELLSRVIPDHARINGLPNKLQQVHSNLRDSRVDPGVRVVPVIPPGAPPTKSGPLIARHLKRALTISERWIISPQNVAAALGVVDTVIFVDDFLGTGSQFSDFLTDTGLISFVPSHCFIYGCLAGHETGINMLRGLFPSLHVAAVERLDASHALFHQDGGSFRDEVNSVECARDFYYGLIDDRRFNITGPNRRGFGHLEIVYAFEHSVPDNTLPILWWDQSSQWRHLFDR